jgi:hypothetical protein
MNSNNNVSHELFDDNLLKSMPLFMSMMRKVDVFRGKTRHRHYSYYKGYAPSGFLNKRIANIIHPNE